MVDNKLFEDISCEEFEDAMRGFEEWFTEEIDFTFDEWEACFLADLENNA